MSRKAQARLRYVYRLVHRDNIPWLLAHGIASRNHNVQCPSYKNIGNAALIGRRALREVPVTPGGVLNDYVPFYFCTHSVMLYNIHTGRVEGVESKQGDIVYLVSAVERLVEQALAFVFTDRHAYVTNAKFFSDPADLAQLDWPLILARDFRRDPDDPGKTDRRQAECLVHGLLPVSALLGIACHNEATSAVCRDAVEANRLELPVRTKVDWYF